MKIFNGGSIQILGKSESAAKCWFFASSVEEWQLCLASLGQLTQLLSILRMEQEAQQQDCDPFLVAATYGNWRQ